MYFDRDGHAPMPWWGKILIGVGFVLAGAVVTALTAGTGVGFIAAFGSALLVSAKAVAISTAISAGIGFAMGGLTTGTWEGAFFGMLDGTIDGFMWGGIFAGGAQILSGGFKVLANLGIKTTASGGIKNTGILAPNRVRKAGEIADIATKGQKIHEYGGQFFKIGKFLKLDVGAKTLLHLHMWPAFAAHVPLGTILAGVIGGF